MDPGRTGRAGRGQDLGEEEGREKEEEERERDQRGIGMGGGRGGGGAGGGQATSHRMGNFPAVEQGHSGDRQGLRGWVAFLRPESAQLPSSLLTPMVR